VENYLFYLSNEENINEGGFWKGPVGYAIKYSMIFAPAAILAWKAANGIVSNAVRKCGALKKRNAMFGEADTPGYTACLCRERIKGYKQKILALNKMMLDCDKNKNPVLCKQKIKLEIEKAKNKIRFNQATLKNILEESTSIQEILPVAAAIGAGAAKIVSPAVFIIAGYAVDKTKFYLFRTAQVQINDAVKKCGIFKEGAERELCMAKHKVPALTKKLQIYKSMLQECKQRNNPAKCIEKISKKIKNVERDIQIEKDNILAYSKEINIKKREEMLKNAVRQQGGL